MRPVGIRNKDAQAARELHARPRAGDEMHPAMERQRLKLRQFCDHLGDGLLTSKGLRRLEREQRAQADARVGRRRSATPPLGEATYAVLIRSAVEAGDVGAAARLLERLRARSPERPRRRAYAPLLAALSLRDDPAAVEALWRACPSVSVRLRSHADITPQYAPYPIGADHGM